MQYLQHIHPVARPMLERYALLVCIGLIWAFAAILTVAGAYKNVKQQTKLSCRTDHSFLMSSAPWYILHLKTELASYCLFDSCFFIIGSRFHILFSGVPLYSEQVMYLGWWVLHLFLLLRFAYFSNLGLHPILSFLVFFLNKSP